MKTQPLTYAEMVQSTAPIVAALLIARPDDYLPDGRIAWKALQTDAELIIDNVVINLADKQFEVQAEIIADEKAEDEPFKT